MEHILMMTNKDLLLTALQQSAIDCNCKPEDFLQKENIVTLSRKHPAARAYLPLPFACDLVSYGNNIVAQVRKDLKDTVKDFINTYPTEHCFETPNMQILEQKLAPYDLQICFMAEYFLPDLTKLEPHSCKYEIRLLHPQDFQSLYLPQWSNALCADRKEKDVLCVGAYDGDALIGLAGASADCETMYQIGIDVLPEYRRQGIAAALTSRLTEEILALGKVPFYCAAWSNIRSVRNAITCGYRPAWVELTAREKSFVEKCNIPQNLVKTSSSIPLPTLSLPEIKLPDVDQSRNRFLFQ